MALAQGFPHYRVFAHHDCIHNQVTALNNRVLFDTEMVPDTEAHEYYLAACRKFGRSLGLTPEITFEEFLDHYTGAKRTRYENAVRQYRQYGLIDRDSWVKMFIKCEKIKFSDGPNGKANPDPRAIQFRGPVYSSIFARYLKPIERKIYHARGSKVNGWPIGRQIAKGLNQLEKGMLYKEKWDMFKDPAGIVIDGTRFDAHVTEVLQRGEHIVYVLCNPSKELLQLLRLQVRNRGVTTKGITYEVWFRRMSGDMNTAVGNCLIMVNMIVSYFNRYFPDVKYQLMDDGDDCIILMERADKDRVFPLGGPLFSGHCAGLGMNIKVESHILSVEETSWCQSSPILMPEGYKFIRDPRKVISGALVSEKWLTFGSPKSRARLCNTIGMCEAILNLGVPVLQSFAQALIRNSKTQLQLRSLDQGDQLLYRVRKELGKSVITRIPSVIPRCITDESRLSFSLAFGITIDEQLHFEAVFDSWSFSLETPEPLPLHIDVSVWDWLGEEPEFQ